MTEVKAAMPTIVFVSKDAAGNDLVAVKVTIDGKPIADRLEGTPLSIDPGAHAFTFETPGQAAIQKQFVIREGEKDRRERIVFGAPSVVAPTANPTEPIAPTPFITSSPSTPADSGAASSGLGTQRILAIVAAGVGVAGLGVGTVYGLSAMSKHTTANNACSMSQCSTQGEVDLWNQAVFAGNVSTIGFVVGAAGLAGAAALWFTAPHGSSESGGKSATQVGLGLGTLQVQGVW